MRSYLGSSGYFAIIKLIFVIHSLFSFFIIKYSIELWILTRPSIKSELLRRYISAFIDLVYAQFSSISNIGTLQAKKKKKMIKEMDRNILTLSSKCRKALLGWFGLAFLCIMQSVCLYIVYIPCILCIFSPFYIDSQKHFGICTISLWYERIFQWLFLQKWWDLSQLILATQE